MSRIPCQEITRILPKLKRFAFGLCGSSTVAEDLVQEACARLLSDPKDKTHYFEQWLFRTIRNLHIDQVRSHSVARQYQGKMRWQNDDQLETRDPMEVLDTLDRVKEAILSLPEEQRSIMLLVGVEGFSYKQAAEILEIPMGTVTSRLARARKRLLELVPLSPDDRGTAAEVGESYANRSKRG